MRQSRETKPNRLSRCLAWLTQGAQTHLFKIVAVGLLVIWLGTAWGVYRFERNAQGANVTTFGEGVWWGIVTVLTVGYGDRYPVTTGGRVLAGVLMLAGVAAVGILTARISSYFLESALREGRGIVDATKLKGHFVICGWKEEMHELLAHILDFNGDLQSSDLVVVANVNRAAVDLVKSHARLKDLNVILGDYSSEMVLRGAAPERARRILVLADRSAGPNGQPPTQKEVDARTIMTTMTLSHIARGTLVTAEVIDPKMDEYLKLASVSEVIYSREYSRLLIGNASGGTGVANILFDLLDPRHPTCISTRAIAEERVARTYAELKKGLEAEVPGLVVIGVLENSGNRHRIRELALRRAQKTPDMGQLVNNLKAVKEIQCNHPRFNPPSDYVVMEGSMAIVIENREQALNVEGRGPTRRTG